MGFSWVRVVNIVAHYWSVSGHILYLADKCTSRDVSRPVTSVTNRSQPPQTCQALIAAQTCPDAEAGLTINLEHLRVAVLLLTMPTTGHTENSNRLHQQQ